MRSVALNNGGTREADRRLRWIVAGVPIKLLVFGVVGMGLAPGVMAQLMDVTEAEKGTIVCNAGKDPAPNLFATGRLTTPAFWGREAGDSVSWTANVKVDMAEPRLAVRYSYAARHYRGFAGAEDPKRILRLVVDEGTPIEVSVPDTGWWELFESADVALPALKRGPHRFRIESPAAHAVTTLDCFIVHGGALEKIPVLLRTSTIARSENKRWAIRATPGAPLKLRPEKIFAEFDQIYELYEKYMGWTPPTPVPINLVEDARWPNPGATSFQNNGGVWFRAGVMDREQGNWCHEMTHMFYVAHFPWWFDESSVRTLTTFVSYPRLYSSTGKPETDRGFRQAMAAGKELMGKSGPVDNIDALHGAMMAKYGLELLSRFFHACVEAGGKGELDFKPGRHLTKQEIAKCMSAAAGEDVTPMYQRWTGWEKAE